MVLAHEGPPFLREPAREVVAAGRLVHGADDDLVKPHNTHELARELQAAGRPVRKLMLDRAGHRKVLLGLARPVRWWSDVLTPIATFLEELRQAEA